MGITTQANTTDTRTHVMGDMLMITGTFTDGGLEISYDGLLSNIIAAGANLTGFPRSNRRNYISMRHRKCSRRL